jgi:hypothetical protein
MEEKKPNNTRIVWARSLSNGAITELLQMKLLESRAGRGTHVELLNELVHEIKYRLSGGKQNAKPGTKAQADARESA